MRYSGFEIDEISRSVALYPGHIKKTFLYADEGNDRQERLIEDSVRLFLSIPLNRVITTVRNIEAASYKITAIQKRIRCSTTKDDLHFFDFVENVYKVNASGWIFGDINFKNVVFDGARYRIIDFEPFTCVVKNKTPQYRVTRPYFHCYDEAHKKVSCLTDRIGLIGLFLRINFGLRESKSIFCNNIKDITQACFLNHCQFRDYLCYIRQKH